MPGNPVNCRRRDVAQCRADPCCAKAEAIQDWSDGAARRIGDLIEGAARPQIAKRAPENGDDLRGGIESTGRPPDHGANPSCFVKSDFATCGRPSSAHGPRESAFLEQPRKIGPELDEGQVVLGHAAPDERLGKRAPVPGPSSMTGPVSGVISCVIRSARAVPDTASPEATRNGAPIQARKKDQLVVRLSMPALCPGGVFRRNAEASPGAG